MKKDELYIIRGTGLPLDGTLVLISDGNWNDGDDYVSVIPYKSDIDIEPIRIKGKYLQHVGDKCEYTYKVSISKLDENNLVIDEAEFTIKNTIKNVNPVVITDWIDTNLSPLFKD